MVKQTQTTLPCVSLCSSMDFVYIRNVCPSFSVEFGSILSYVRVGGPESHLSRSGPVYGERKVDSLGPSVGSDLHGVPDTLGDVFRNSCRTKVPSVFASRPPGIESYKVGFV